LTKVSAISVPSLIEAATIATDKRAKTIVLLGVCRMFLSKIRGAILATITQELS
jgi:hypothetical protein